MDPRRSRATAPTVFPGDEPFWEAAREGRLLAKACLACQRLHFTPRPHCPFCGHARTEWRPLSGRGTVYAHTRVERAPRPTAPAIVETEEGLRLHSVVMDADVHALRIGDPVVTRFVSLDGGPPLLAFTTPAAEAARAYSRAAMAALGEGDSARAAAIRTAVVIGAGHMGAGIALALLAGGLAVRLVDNSDAALDAARQGMAETLAADVARGRLPQAAADERLARLATGTALDAVRDADLVVEAVFEDLQVKRTLFSQLDALAPPHALLATNTSTLDVGAIAAATGRPGAVIGLHFFNPAQVMRLLEIVRAPTTDAATVSVAQGLGRRLGKVPVVVGVCDGFVGNRLMIARERQAARLLLEGALPQQVDRVLRRFGLPMGTFELQDMAGGIALTFRARQRSGQRDWLIEQLHARGRLGLRAGRGYYRYEPGQRRPLVDPEVTTLIEEASRQAGIERRTLSDTEIEDRLILPMVNEAAKLLAEGIVERASDIDLVWQHGYGWPDWKGGPVHYADNLGLAEVVARLTALAERHGAPFHPCGPLVRLAAAGRRLSDPQVPTREALP